jgi:hypothetical protein
MVCIPCAISKTFDPEVVKEEAFQHSIPPKVRLVKGQSMVGLRKWSDTET